MNKRFSIAILLHVFFLTSCGGFDLNENELNEDSNNEGLEDILAESESDTNSDWTSVLFQSDKTTTNNRFSELLKSCVTITLFNEGGNKYGIGSGVFVANDIIATNFHVIEDVPAKITVTRTSDEESVEGVVYKFDKVHDVALIKLKIERPTPIKISSILPQIGDDIVVAGSPQGLVGTISKGIVSSIRKFHPYDYDMIQISAPISHGSSGGPVVNSNGELIGISVSTLSEGQNLNFAVPVKYIKHLLDE